MFYLTTHSTHFYLWLYGVTHMVMDHSDSERGRKEGNVLFNDALNTFLSTVIWRQTYGYGRKKMFYLKTHSTQFYLRLYGIKHMVKEGRKCFI